MNPNGSVNVQKNSNCEYEKIQTGECDEDILKLCHSMLSVVCLNFDILETSILFLLIFNCRFLFLFLFLFSCWKGSE
jgi:hypothetical protein